MRQTLQIFEFGRVFINATLPVVMTTEKPPQIKAGPPSFLIKAPGWYSHIWRHVGAVEGWLRPLRFDLRWLKRWRNPGPDLASAARTWRDAPRNSAANLQLYSVWTTRESAAHVTSSPTSSTSHSWSPHFTSFL